jgi:hypothetical protein
VPIQTNQGAFPYERFHGNFEQARDKQGVGRRRRTGLRPDYRRDALVSSQSKTRAGSHTVLKPVHQWLPTSCRISSRVPAWCPGFRTVQNQGRITYLLAVRSTVVSRLITCTSNRSNGLSCQVRLRGRDSDAHQNEEEGPRPLTLEKAAAGDENAPAATPIYNVPSGF